MKTQSLVLSAIMSIMMAASTAMAGPLVSSGGRINGPTGVFVAFSSIGSGINQQALRAYMATVESATAAGGVLGTSYSQKGREGEVLACVYLKDAGFRVAFIKAIAPVILQERERITRVYVGPDCSDLSKASEQDLGAYL